MGFILKSYSMKAAALVALGFGVVFGGITANQTAAAKARNRVIKVVKTPGTDYHAKTGAIYSTAKLTKKIHDAGYFKHTVFFSNRTATVKKANGKTAKYDAIISRNGKVSGWIWQGNLVKIIAKQAQSTASSSSTDANSDTDTTGNDSTDDGGTEVTWESDGNTTVTVTYGSDGTKTTQTTKGGSTVTKVQPTTNPASKFSLTDYRASFLKYLNQERAARGLQPYTESTGLDQLAQQRSTQLPSNFSHYDAQGNIIADELAPQFGVGFGAECLSQNVWSANSTSDSVAKSDIHEYIYDDAASNWGHRAILLSPELHAIGMGATLQQHANGFMATWTAADFN